MRTLRSKSLRNALWRAAGGKCEICGCDLPDDWHADHIVPWSVRPETNVFGMQALCPRCNLKKGNRMASAAAVSPWHSFLCPTDEFQTREGQLRMFEWASTVDFGNSCPRVAAELITGYGKTLIAYGVFEILRQRGLADRMLVFVPGDEQRSQFADDEAKAKKFFSGCTASAWIVTKDAKDITTIRRNEADVFIACYQQLGSDGFFDTMIDRRDGAKWFFVLDEYHHLYQDGEWAKRQEKLEASARLYLSATPYRSDGLRLHGAPSEPIATIDYKAAYQEQAVRLIVCHNDHYQVHCEGPDGEELHFATSDLLAENVGDFETFEVKKQLRYKRDYLDWMLLDPIQKLQQKQLTHPAVDGAKRHQMIVFAMSCKHADHVCGTIREIAKQINGSDFSCEWVGVGEGIDGAVKSDKENKRIIEAFREGRLDVLVQVNKCGEGFSVDTASVLVFLSLVKAEPYIIQQIGRGLRRNSALEFDEDVCDVFVSSDSPVADIVRTMEAQVRNLRDLDDPREPRDKQQLSLLDIPDITVIRSQHSHREVLTPGGVEIVLNSYDREFCHKYGIQPEDLLRRDELRGKNQHPVYSGPAQAARNSQERMAAVEAQVKVATSLLVGNVIKLRRASGESIRKSLPGELKLAVNNQWKNEIYGMSHDEMTEIDFRQKHEWLQKLNREIVSTRRLPVWLS